MLHSERKPHYASATGFTRIEHVPLSLSTVSMWHPERKRQFASTTGFTSIEHTSRSLSTTSMWHARRKRHYAFAGGFTRYNRVPLSLTPGPFCTRNVNGNTLLQLARLASSTCYSL
ncbi:hypothetical protein MRX96_017368 [Rhipicephalus microplus]